MSSVMHPVGPMRRETYWRRRLVAIVVVVLVAVAVFFGIRAVVLALAGDGAAGAAGEATEEAGGADQPAAVVPAPSETESAAESSGPPACTPEQISLVALSDATSYALDGAARLGMRITNTSEAACTMDAGSAALELVVVSGEDRIWSSDDCQESAQNVPTAVDPGEEGALESNVEWGLVRSAEGCAEGLPELQAGTYQLVARAGELTSEPLAFTIG